MVGRQAPPPGTPLRLAHGESIELGFNQPVVAWSQRTDSGVSTSGRERCRLRAESRQGWGRAGRSCRFLLRPDQLQENATYRLALAAGVKGLEGPLRGDRPQELLIDSYRPLRYLGPTELSRRSPVVLEFSGEVSPQEVVRCLQTTPIGLNPTAVKADPQKPRRLRLEFETSCHADCP